MGSGIPENDGSFEQNPVKGYAGWNQFKKRGGGVPVGVAVRRFCLGYGGRFGVSDAEGDARCAAFNRWPYWQSTQ